jgi:integrase
MPRKPKQEKQTIQVVIDGVPIAVILHPPTAARKSWYAYWAGLVSSKSTAQKQLAEAIAVAENMVRAWKAGGDGKRATLADALMMDAEFDEVQRVHFLVKKRDPAAKGRASKTHKVYLEAAAAFRAITGLVPITRASSTDCELFQRQALGKPKNWRQQHPKSRKDAASVSPNTVLKWSRSLQAAFQRCCRTAGKKCVRGVVPDAKLLDENPWNGFTWIEGAEKPVRQFDPDELLSFMDYLQAEWPSITVAQMLAKVFLWSRCRLEAVTSLKWDAERPVGTERHFHVVEKRGVEWWFRLPEAAHQELKEVRTASPYIFAAYNEQLRRFHRASSRPERAGMVAAEFSPRCLGDWFYDRLADWSATSPKGHAHPHVFRKTSLQLAWDGEDQKRQAVVDAKVSEKVLRTSYLQRSDKERREESNRNYHRIAAALPAEVARRYGYPEPNLPELEERLAAAVAAKDWAVVAQLSAEISSCEPPAGS